MAAQTETNFALTFLQQLSARQQKYAPDFVAPPSTLGSKPLLLLPPMDRPKRKRSSPKTKETGVKITFTSLKPPKINTTLLAPPSQTFHALKSRLAQETSLHPSQLRFLLKNKAIGDSKSVQEVFGPVDEASVILMVMKSPAGSAASTSAGSAGGASVASDQGERMTIDLDAFWEGVREVVMERYPGGVPKEEVFAALKKGYQDAFAG